MADYAATLRAPMTGSPSISSMSLTLPRLPAYLDSAIKGTHERASVLTARDDTTRSLTRIGTVSPANGNFDEPVTQLMLDTIETFLGLSYDRAYKCSYSAIDPPIPWSRYFEQLRSHFDRHVHPGWMELVESLANLIRDGNAIRQMVQVTGEEGISLEYFVTYQKSRLLDIAYYQQDALDPVDVSAPLNRKRERRGPRLFCTTCRIAAKPQPFAARLTKLRDVLAAN